MRSGCIFLLIGLLCASGQVDGGLASAGRRLAFCRQAAFPGRSGGCGGGGQEVVAHFI